MATTVARLQATLGADTRGFDRAMGHSESRLKSIGKTAGLAIGAAGIGGIALVLRTGIREWKQQQIVTAQTNAVLKSTKGVANVTAKEITSLATEIMKKSGIDDEAIQSGENLLLTFKNIRDETGKGNDIFRQATELTTDLSVAFGKDLNSSAILVGKALQDPVKGMSALRRVGVTLTEQQQNLVKSLVASGDTMGAQKIILGELRSEVGGSAEAFGKTLPGQIAIAKESFNNWAGELVAKMIPVIQDTIGWVRDHWPEISAAIKTFWADTKPALTGFLQLIRSIFNFVRDHWSQIGPIVKAMANTVGAAMKILGGILQVMADLLSGDWSKAWKDIKEIMRNVADLVKNYFTPQVLALKGAFNLLKDAVGNVIGRLGDITGKGAAKALGVIKDAVTILNSGLHGMVRALNKIVDAFKWLIDNAKKIGGFFGGLAGKVTGAIPGIGDASGRIRDIGRGGGGGGTGPASISPKLYDELAGARKFGLVLTSGYRPGATTKHGTPSDHGIYPSHAIDVGGSSAGMAGFFRWLIGQRDVKEAFYDPLGSIFNGALSSYREGGHSDHVHVATYDQGGYLRPGWNLAYNGLGRPEPVGGGSITIPISIGGEHFATVQFDMLRRKAKVFEQRNGKPAFGGA